MSVRRRGNYKCKGGCQRNTTKSIRDSAMCKRDDTRSEGRPRSGRLGNCRHKDGRHVSSIRSKRGNTRSFKMVEDGYGVKVSVKVEKSINNVAVR